MGKSKKSQCQEVDNTEDKQHAVQRTSEKPIKMNEVNDKGCDSQETQPESNDIKRCAEQMLPTIQEEEGRHSEDTRETSEIEMHDKRQHEDLDNDKSKAKGEQSHSVEQETAITQGAQTTEEDTVENMDAI